MPLDFVSGNRLSLLNSGREYFPALQAALGAAREEIYLESYIFAKDAAGDTVVEALIAAAARGVRVQVLVDGFGAKNFGADYLPRLTQADVHGLFYRPEVAFPNFRRRRLRRLHRKLVVVDGRIAFVGGINIVDDHNGPAEHCPRYDYAVRVEGPVVGDIHTAMRHMWEIVVWANFKRRYRVSGPPPQRPGPAGEQWAAFQKRDNIRHRNAILNAYLEAIQEARHNILIANAYFMPGYRFRHALRAAARRGVQITILLQGVSDHRLMRYATQALYGALLADGIHIFEYQKSFLHAKVAVIDDDWATVGSSNIDPFSLLLAKESNLFVKDREFATGLKTSVETAMRTGARQIKATDLVWYSRFLRWISYGIVRLAVSLAGFGPKHWQDDEEKPGRP